MRKILCAIIGLFAMTAHAATTDVCDFDIANIYKVGTPTITNAGIYTTNSSESYIRTQNDVAFATANTWSFKWRFTYHPANSDQGIMSGDGGTNVQAIINSAGRPRFSFGDDTSWNAGVWNDTALTFAYQDGVTYDNEIYFDGTRYGFKVNGTEIGGVDNTTKAANTYFAIGVERGRTSAQYSRAEWDLTHTSLTLDGVEQLPWCGKQIKVATTKYTETVFNPLNTALQSAISVVDSVVSRTITQAASIATLQSGKQTRPDETCPAYKQCLLVEDEQGVPHWYQITDPFRDFVAPIIANNVNAASSTSTQGYTQLEYIESTGTQWIDTGFATSREAKFGIKFRDTLFQTDKGFFGSSSWMNSLSFYMNSNVPTIRYCLNNTAFSLDITNATHSGELISSSSGVVGTFDGQEISFPKIVDNNSGDGNIYLFSGGRNRGGLKTKIDWFKIWDSSDNLVRNFVPVIDNATGKVGMYDTVGGRFYGNAASSGDDFTPGPIVENDADVPGMTWAATWAADASTGVSAGTVYGIARCNASGSALWTVASNTLQTNTNWITVGEYCWCHATGVDNGNGITQTDGTWVANGNTQTVADCLMRCALICGSRMTSNQSLWSAVLSGM